MTFKALVATPDPPKFNLFDRVTVVNASSDWNKKTGVIIERRLDREVHNVYKVRIDGEDPQYFMESELEGVTSVGFEPTEVSDTVTVTFPRGVDGLLLNPEDPFEAVLIDMVQTNRRKRKDYAVDGSPFSNFDDTSKAMGIEGFSASDSALFNVHQKLARLRSLRANGRLDDPANESVEDTYLDLAVYAVIAYAVRRFPDGKVQGNA